MVHWVTSKLFIFTLWFSISHNIVLVMLLLLLSIIIYSLKIFLCTSTMYYLGEPPKADNNPPAPASITLSAFCWYQSLFLWTCSFSESHSTFSLCWKALRMEFFQYVFGARSNSHNCHSNSGYTCSSALLYEWDLVAMRPDPKLSWIFCFFR